MASTALMFQYKASNSAQDSENALCQKRNLTQKSDIYSMLDNTVYSTVFCCLSASSVASSDLMQRFRLVFGIVWTKNTAMTTFTCSG